MSRDSRRVDALQRHIETSTDASLRIAERTSAVAQATLQELSQQSLGLERASKSLETAEKGVEESEDTMAALNRKCGCFAFPGVTACFPARRASRFRVSETQTNVEALETYRSSTSQPKLRKTKGGFSLKKAPGGTKGTALVVEKNPIKAQTDLKSNAIDSALEYLHQASGNRGKRRGGERGYHGGVEPKVRVLCFSRRHSVLSRPSCFAFPGFRNSNERGGARNISLVDVATETS